MSAPLDLTKPLRTKYGHPIELVAVDPSDTLIRLLQAERAAGGRNPGQTVLVEITYEDGEKRLRWYHRDGRFHDVPSSSSDLENVPPEPVVVKTRRGVITDGSRVLRTTGFLNEFDIKAIVEFTVTDGKLTAVEIVS